MTKFINIKNKRRFYLLTLISATLIALLTYGCALKKTAPSKQLVTKPDSLTTKSLIVSEKYLEADKEKIIGNFENAIKLFEECIKLDPKHHPSYYQIADIKHITGNYNSTLEYIEKALLLDSQNGWYLVLKGDALMKIENYKEATKTFQTIVKIWPEKKIWYEGLAKAQLKGGEYGEAIKSYEEILNRFRFDEKIFFKTVELYEHIGKSGTGEAKLKDLVKENPYNSFYLRQLAAFYIRNKKEDKALPIWDEILKLEPENGEIRFDKAGYYRNKGKDSLALEELIKAFTTPNLSIDAKIVVLLSYYTLTEKYSNLLPQAYRLLDLTIKAHPDNPKGWSVYADFLVRDQRYKEALEMFNKVVSIDSTKYPVWEQLLYCAFNINDFIALEEKGATAVAVFPDQPLLYFYYGHGLLFRGKYEESRKIFSRGMLFVGFNDTISPWLSHSIALTFQHEGNMAKAEEYFSKVLLKGKISGRYCADYIRFMVLSGFDDNMSKLVEVSTEELRNGLWVVLFGMWYSVATKKSDNLAGEIESFLNRYEPNFYALESVESLSFFIGFDKISEKCRNKAIEISNGAIILEQK